MDAIKENKPPSVSLSVPSGVMPPDEYYYNVNDSVYTNAVAKFRYWESDADVYTYSEHRRCKR